jgi:hypothetical protein
MKRYVLLEVGIILETISCTEYIEKARTAFRISMDRCCKVKRVKGDD